MPKGKHILVFRSGAKLMMSEDGSLAYMGGDAYAIGVNDSTRFDELKCEMADMWKFDPGSITVKYLLPNTSNKLVTISNDIDIRSMLEVYEDSTTVDVYVFTGTTGDISTIPGIRSSCTPTVESVISAHQVACDDILSPPEPMNQLAVYSELGILKNATESERFILTKLWENCLTGVQQQFSSGNELRDALRKYCVARGFSCIKTHNDSKRFSAKCKAEGCPWEIFASKLASTKLFVVRKLNDIHTCGAGKSLANHPHALKKVGSK